jgi:hypothetical protein
MGPIGGAEGWRKVRKKWKRAHDAREGRPAAAIPQSTPRRQNTSPFNTGEPPQGLFMPDRSRLSSPSMASQHGQLSQGRARSSTPGRGIRRRCRCHAAPKPFSCERAREQPRGRTTCYKKVKGGILLLSAESQRGPDEHPGLAGNRSRGTRGGRGRG